jgi:hypothetical protein
MRDGASGVPVVKKSNEPIKLIPVPVFTRSEPARRPVSLFPHPDARHPLPDGHAAPGDRHRVLVVMREEEEREELKDEEE